MLRTAWAGSHGHKMIMHGDFGKMLTKLIEIIEELSKEVDALQD